MRRLGCAFCPSVECRQEEVVSSSLSSLLAEQEGGPAVCLQLSLSGLLLRGVGACLG